MQQLSRIAGAITSAVMVAAGVIAAQGRPRGSEPAAAGFGRDAKVEYNRDVRPILSDNCFYCHGPDDAKRKGKFRLDERESAVAKGAIVPGKPADSTLVDRIQTADPDDVMPPVESHKNMTAAQKDVLKRWVAQGAEYQPHWAFIAPVRPPVPQVKTAGWVAQPIDSFILQSWNRGRSTPSPEADQRRLLRRVAWT